MAASDYEEARRRYIGERPKYKELCELSTGLLTKGIREAGVRGEVSARVKDLISFLRKLLRDPEYLSGARPIEDKAGVRIVLPYFDQEPEVRAVIESCFYVQHREETVERLGSDRLGYLAVHYVVRPRERFLNDEQETLFAGMVVEIQVGSIAQRSWAEVSHELLYKGEIEVPVAYQRIVNRLIALVELFDDEVSRVRERIAALPGFETAPLVGALDRELLRFTGRVPDRSLSQEIVPALVGLYRESPGDLFESRIQPWIKLRQERLSELYARYEADFEANPLFYQPEAFLILERAENAPDGLMHAWPSAVPREPMVALAELWGEDAG